MFPAHRGARVRVGAAQGMFSYARALSDCFKLGIHASFSAQTSAWPYDWGNLVCDLPPSPPPPPPRPPLEHFPIDREGELSAALLNVSSRAPARLVVNGTSRISAAASRMEGDDLPPALTLEAGDAGAKLVADAANGTLFVFGALEVTLIGLELRGHVRCSAGTVLVIRNCTWRGGWANPQNLTALQLKSGPCQRSPPERNETSSKGQRQIEMHQLKRQFTSETIYGTKTAKVIKQKSVHDHRVRRQPTRS